MARYKHYSYDQLKLLPISFSRQILPGTFEYTLSHIVDHELDLSIFSARYTNDEAGAPAYDPAILLKIVLYAYSRGITSSREIERCCRKNVIFMALSADTQPHFTTLANFISSMREEIEPLFLEVLLICDEMGLIGREMFAIDGCKLPSNASKEWSGTKAELANKVDKMQGAIRYIMRKHRQEDEQGQPSEHREKEAQQADTMRAQVRKIKAWLKGHDDKPGKGGGAKKSNITDNDSAKMKTSHGVLQGYDGVATVDAKHQVVVHAAAFGKDRSKPVKQSYTAKMKQKIDTPEGRQQYSRRLGIVEPVFAHLASHIGLRRFSLRGWVKVNIQWKLFCIVHNLTKIHRFGYS